MSGALRKMSTFLGYSEPAEDDFREAPVEAETHPDTFAGSETESYEHFVESYQEEPAAPVDLRRIVTVHPTTYNEARVIGESFRDGVPVIVNLTNMSEADARRMVDFSAGLVFGLRGAIERVTPRVFLLTPATVEIDGGSAQAGQSDRFFNQG